MPQATMKEPNTARLAIPPMIFSFFIFLPNRPLMTTPMSGKSGINHTYSNIPGSFNTKVSCFS